MAKNSANSNGARGSVGLRLGGTLGLSLGFRMCLGLRTGLAAVLLAASGVGQALEPTTPLARNSPGAFGVVVMVGKYDSGALLFVTVMACPGPIGTS